MSGAEFQALENIVSDMADIRRAAPERQSLLRVRSPFTGPVNDFRLHADGAKPYHYFDQLLCNYNDPATEWICFEDATKDPDVFVGIM